MHSDALSGIRPGVATAVGDLRQKLAALYGSRLAQVVLYGSHARGDAGLESDIDVLIVLHGPVQAGEEIARTGDIVADLSLRNNVVLSCVFVDTDRYTHARGPLLRNIHREGLPV